MADVRRVIEIALKAVDQSMSRGLDTVRSKLDKTKESANALNSTLSMVGVGVSVVGFTNLIKKSIESGSEIADLSMKLRVGAYELQKYKYAAGQSGIRFGDVSTALRFLAQNLAEAARGNEMVKESFDELGLDATKLSAMSLGSAFDIVVAKLVSMEDGNKQLGTAKDLLGRGGAEALKFSRNLSEMQSEAVRTGAVASQSTIDTMDEIGDKFDGFKSQWSVFWMTETELLYNIGKASAHALTEPLRKYKEMLDLLGIPTSGGLYKIPELKITGNLDIKNQMEAGLDLNPLSFGRELAAEDTTLQRIIDKARELGVALTQEVFKGGTFRIVPRDQENILEDVLVKLNKPAEKPAESDWLGGIDISSWAEGNLDTTDAIADAWARAKENEEMLRAGAEQHGEQIDEMLRAMEDTAQAQADAADEAKRMRDELTRARVEAVDGLVSGVLQLAGATGSATQRWAQGLAKVQAVYRSILAIAQAIAALRIIGAAMSGGSSMAGGEVGGASLMTVAAGGTVRGAAGFRVTGGSPGRDSVRALLMPDETVISRDITRQLARFLGRADAGYISPFALAGAGGGGGGNVTLQVARPIGRLDGLDLGSAAHAAQREFRRRFVE